MTILALLIAVFVPMIAEARISSRHDRALRAAGAVEPRGDVYWLMAVVYPGAFLAMAAEGWWRAASPDAATAVGAIIFAASKGLKYWAVASLGERWTFRVLVPPGGRRVVHGPYRMLRHPNYVAVIGELAGALLVSHAQYAGPASMLIFGALLAIRVVVEEEALTSE